MQNLATERNRCGAAAAIRLPVNSPMEARLHSPTDIAGFRTEARELLAHRVPPEDVTWNAPQEAEDAPAAPEDIRSRTSARAATSIVPASFVRLCEYVVQHRDPQRFALLYRLLWRLVHEPGLRHDPDDVDMSRAQHMAHAVRRDIHKLKVNVRFHPVDDPAHPHEPLQMAYCEPAHHVLEAAAPWLAKRHASTRWVIFTPDRSAYWDGRQLHYGRSGSPPLSVQTPAAVWISRWRSLFPLAA
jgi:probable DNA metabolism protein